MFLQFLQPMFGAAYHFFGCARYEILVVELLMNLRQLLLQLQLFFLQTGAFGLRVNLLLVQNAQVERRS